MTDEFDLDKQIGFLGKYIIEALKKAVKQGDFNELMGVQMELDDGTIYQFPFKVIKTDSQGAYDRCMMVNANIIRKTELLMDIKQELIESKGFESLINRIDNELERNKELE